MDHILSEDWLSRNCDIQEGGLYIFSVTSSCNWPTTLTICRSPAKNWIAMVEQVPAIDDPPDAKCCIAVGNPQTENDVMMLVMSLRGKNDKAWRQADER